MITEESTDQAIFEALKQYQQWGVEVARRIVPIILKDPHIKTYGEARRVAMQVMSKLEWCSEFDCKFVDYMCSRIKAEIDALPIKKEEKKHEQY